MSNFVQGAMLLLLSLILGAILAGFINTNGYTNENFRKLSDKLDEISAKLDGMDPMKPQFSVMHGFYKKAKKGEQPFRVVQVDELGYLILSAEAPSK